MSCSGIDSGGLVTFDVKVNGSFIPDIIEVENVVIDKSVNRISKATIVILDGNPSEEGFTVSSSATFVPGNKVSIELGYESVNELVFEGIITKQSVKVNGAAGPTLEVECRDEAIRMIVGRKSATYAKKKDSDIINSIISTYKGLSANVTATQTKWQEQVQYYTTDWDFIMARAESNGMIITTLGGKVSVFPPDKDKKSVLKIEYGNNLLEFNADLDAITQLASVKGNSWGYPTQKITTASANNNYAGAGNLSTKKLSEVVGLKDFQVQTTAPLEATDLTNWSKATLIKSEFSKIRGEVKFQGSNKVNPGKYLTLDGLGDRFNGDHFMSNVKHEVAHGNWVTTVTIGLSPVWFTEEPDVMAPPASGLLPGVQGLFNATVKKMYEDPDNQFRILIDIPLFDSKGEGIWARLANFYSTSGAGAFFLPEVGNEVVVGFLNEDPRYPIILGSLYSSTKNKPYKGLIPDKKNTKKAIVSKQGIFIEFDDENKKFTIETPSKNTAIFDDKSKEITIKDQNNNSIVMSSSGITIKSAKNINIEANQKLTLKGKQGVTIDSSPGDVTIKGTNIKETASVKYSAKGSAQAELTGGAQTTIKGAMVMIN
ncbi:type VI secretion system tip protein VgrG [uncultured Tenacibaculum sp.]|uniref:type VI secretion system tip protein VgrG n=1 Tax=uncultured Tenacibaculum sp. TaxID=174713 RepID=UPI00261C74D9|nr:type VI secretion system tip protein VgrG [uncultured Tenacibaculum sp.]